MTSEDLAPRCPDDILRSALASLEQSHEPRRVIERLLQEFPSDPRLLFLLGSLLASEQRYDEARVLLSRALEIDTAFEVARFQLGFLMYTSGQIGEAQAVWAAFEKESSEHPFRLLTAGLQDLAADRFQEAETKMRAGMLHNTEHPAINRDMQLLLSALDPLRNQLSEATSAEAPVTSTQFLLDQLKRPKH